MTYLFDIRYTLTNFAFFGLLKVNIKVSLCVIIIGPFALYHFIFNKWSTRIWCLTRFVLVYAIYSLVERSSLSIIIFCHGIVKMSTFVDPAELNKWLIDLICKGKYVLLYGSRASGKSTWMLRVMEQLEEIGYYCI